MPIQKVAGGGWKFGDSGKIYTTKKGAMQQAKAIYAAGYKKKPAL